MISMVREARLEDLGAIARLHVDIWHEAFRGLLPAQMADAPDLPGAERDWASFLDGTGAHKVLLVAEEAGRPVAFGAAGPARDAELGTEGEVYAVYVARRLQYRGIGTRLMGAMARRLGQAGVTSLGFWVARQNVAAVAFARALGGLVSGTRPAFCALGMPYLELALVWPDAKELRFFDEEAGCGSTALRPGRSGRFEARELGGSDRALPDAARCSS